MNAIAKPTLLSLAPGITVAILAAPIIVGIFWTVLPAFGWLPAAGGTHLSMDAWHTLVNMPGFGTALRLTLMVGLSTTFLALVFAIGFCALAATSAEFRKLQYYLNPLLASPHSAIALGFAFLIAPSGWLVRLASPWATGFAQPPHFNAPQDPYGVSFVAGLLLKEAPYLVLMIVAASSQVAVRTTLASTRALGQMGPVAWVKAIFPQIYSQIRLPIFAVLTFSLSAVDVGIILAPGTPPPLAVLATRLFSGYNLELYFPAAAAATLQLAISAIAIAIWMLAEKPVAALARRWIERGGRDYFLHVALNGLAVAAVLFGALGLLSIALMVIWSVADSWRFPAALPPTFHITNWTAQADRVGVTIGSTFAIGLLSVMAALLLSLACLENEQRRRLRPGAGALWLLYFPLLVPQIAFMFGVQVMLVRLGLDGTLAAVTWAHLVFLMPYVFLSLADPFRALDPRYGASASALGVSPRKAFFIIKLPLLTRPILTAIAVGFAVSVGQYLPTLFAGAGRIATLTTEAVTLSGGGDRRIIGVFAVLQSALPLLIYGCAFVVPALLFRNRRDLAQ